MTKSDEYAAQLRARPEAEWETFLLDKSGLPGPRGNLELADAFAAVADRATILRLVSDRREYLRFCGAEALGQLVLENPDDAGIRTLLRERATDGFWRVREGAARALQLVGDCDRLLLRTIVAEWMADADPWVRRAGVAAICEPRLLADPETREAALSACRGATQWLTSLSADQRREPGARNLRQALGYCWSVAVAADPTAGLIEFDGLRSDPDPDIQWIVKSNLAKARLRRLIPEPSAP